MYFGFVVPTICFCCTMSKCESPVISFCIARYKFVSLVITLCISYLVVHYWSLLLVWWSFTCIRGCATLHNPNHMKYRHHDFDWTCVYVSLVDQTWICVHKPFTFELRGISWCHCCSTGNCVFKSRAMYLYRVVVPTIHFCVTGRIFHVVVPHVCCCTDQLLVSCLYYQPHSLCF